jgi:hypothetical protein
VIRIPISVEAFEAVASMLPVGSVTFERGDDGQIFISLEKRALDRLDALRHPGEGYSETIIRLATVEASRPGRKRFKP